MLRYTLLLSFCLALFTACTAAPATPPTPTPLPTAPAEQPLAEPSPTRPAEGEGVVYITGVELILQESEPVQVTAVVNGDLADGCTELNGTEINRVDNSFYISFKSIWPAHDMCSEATVPFTESVELDTAGLPAGDYVVVVDKVQATFTLP
jgi:hypothetical protein